MVNYILTESGIKFDLLDPKPEQFNINDIAVSLSRQTRFNGHISESYEDDIYSVAQHSVYVKWFITDHLQYDEAKAWGLLHDGAEAYYGDVVSPLKSLIPEYKQIEAVGEAALRDAFQIPFDPIIEKAVAAADFTLCRLEAAEMTDHPYDHWKMGAKLPFDITVIDPEFYVWSPSEARDAYLEEFHALAA